MLQCNRPLVRAIYTRSKVRTMTSSSTPLIIVTTAVFASLLLSGCNAAHNKLSAHANAPGLRDDAPLSSRGGTNPNAPYTMVDHSAHLVQRTAIVDVNAAMPCAAADLSLFESGAHVDGERRSVRLNLVNHAKVPCRLGGYPSISLLKQDGSLLGNVVIEKVTATTLEAALHANTAALKSSDEQRPSPYVLLAPSGEASFEVGWTSGPACDQIGSIAVSAPGTVQSFTVKHNLSVCEGRILVTAVSDGTEL